jgi:hypothetical protein
MSIRSELASAAVVRAGRACEAGADEREARTVSSRSELASVAVVNGWRRVVSAGNEFVAAIENGRLAR